MGWPVFHRRGKGDHHCFCSAFGRFAPCIVSSQHMLCLTLLPSFSSSQLSQVWVRYIEADSSCGTLLYGVPMLFLLHRHQWSVTCWVSWTSTQHYQKQSHPLLNPTSCFFESAGQDSFSFLSFWQMTHFFQSVFWTGGASGVICRGLTNINFEDILLVAHVIA